MFNNATSLINDAKKIVIIQAENPDGDSLGSSLALEEILSDAGKDVVLYCAIDIPKYIMCCCQIDREPLLLDKTDKRQQVLLRLKSKKEFIFARLKEQ